MTTVNSVTSTTSTTSAASTSNSSAYSALGNFETFLELLTVELQNQDPTDPMDSTEWVSQLCDLSTLYQTEDISNNVAYSGALSLIGKEVAYQTTDSSGSTVSATGTVASVVTSGGETYLKILNSDGQYERVSPSSVYEVTEG